MGRRRKDTGNGAPAGATAPAALPAQFAALVGWPPSYACPYCKIRSFSAAEIRAGYCDRCKQWLANLERAYLSAAKAKTLPKA